MERITITMLRTHFASENGTEVKKLLQGSTYEFKESIATQLVKEGIAIEGRGAGKVAKAKPITREDESKIYKDEALKAAQAGVDKAQAGLAGAGKNSE